MRGVLFCVFLLVFTAPAVRCEISYDWVPQVADNEVVVQEELDDVGEGRFLPDIKTIVPDDIIPETRIRIDDIGKWAVPGLLLTTLVLANDAQSIGRRSSRRSDAPYNPIAPLARVETNLIRGIGRTVHNTKQAVNNIGDVLENGAYRAGAMARVGSEKINRGFRGMGHAAVRGVAGVTGAVFNSGRVVGTGLKNIARVGAAGARNMRRMAGAGARNMGRAVYNVGNGIARIGSTAASGVQNVGRAYARGVQNVQRTAADRISRIGSAYVQGIQRVGNVAGTGIRRLGTAYKRGFNEVGHGFRRIGNAYSRGFHNIRDRAYDGVSRIGEYASEGAVQLGGLATDGITKVSEVAEVIPTSLAAVAKERKVQDCLLQTICYASTPFLTGGSSRRKRMLDSVERSLDEGVSLDAAISRAEVETEDAARVVDGPVGNQLGEPSLRMEDCEVFECGVAAIGRKAYEMASRKGLL